MSQPNQTETISYIRSRLRNELAPHFTYHSYAHTFEDVLPTALELARRSDVSADGQILLAVSAAFHDAGFLDTRVEHEARSVAIAREILPRFGYDAAQMETITGMIMATCLPQSPHTLLEQILADADLGVLGRDIFWARNPGLRAEMAFFGQVYSDRAWYEMQADFLTSHTYFTIAARVLLNAGKQNNLAEIKRRYLAADRHRT